MFINDISEKIEIVEVGPRDGFQNECDVISLENKVRTIESLVETGLKYIEATSFVHPKWVPQLADADQLLQKITSIDKVRFSVLVPNEKGFERALQANVKEICLFLSASESHNKKNVNMTPEESMKNFSGIIKAALSKSMIVRCIIATSFACPFEGTIKPEAVLKIATDLVEYGVNEVVLADTIGHANPRQVYELFSLLKSRVPEVIISAHFHDTMGMGLSNVLAALQAGIRKFDASVGGLGGCPFAPGASGNIATEDIVNMLNRMGYKTGISLEKLLETSSLLENIVGRPASSHMSRLELV